MCSPSPIFTPQSLEVPLRWLSVLAAIQEAGFSEAFIGGGALRDLDNGVPVKDVDIFLIECPDTLSVLGKALGYPGEDVSEFSQKYEDSNPAIRQVLEFRHDRDPYVEGPIFNIIVCSGEPGDSRAFRSAQMARFDMGICRISHDGFVAGLERTPEYIRDRNSKTFTILHQSSRSIERARRIIAKYPPEWRIVSVQEISRTEDSDLWL